MQNNDGKTLRQHLLLWANRFHFDVMVRKKGWFFEVVLHERFRSRVRAIGIVLTTIGLLSAFFAFESVFGAFLFGLCIYLLSTLIEKAIFSYRSLYVHPLPDFEIENDKWIGVSFGFAEDHQNRLRIPMVGWTMSDTEYARKVHSLLLRWSYGALEDEKRNIRASVIIDGNAEYVFFCYPNMNRETAAHFYRTLEKEWRKKLATDVQHRLTTMLIFGRRCRITANSIFPSFRKEYRDGNPYLFSLTTAGVDGQAKRIQKLEDFILYNLKIRSREELDRTDIEYDFLRIMGQ